MKSKLLCLGILVGLATCVCSTVLGQGNKPAAVKPNIVFVLVDDMGYGDLSCYGGRAGQTPHIDSLAKEGIRFTQFYSGAPICSPSRTSLMTGQNPVHWKITSFLASRGENERRGMAQWLDLKAPTVARTLKQVGYATGHFGKWHLGGQRDVGEAPLITEYGFDESLTQFEGLGDRILPLLDAYDGQPAKKYSLGSENLGRGNIEWMDRSIVTEGFVNRTLDFIKRTHEAKKPFYVNVWLDDVHSPFFPPEALRSDESKRELYQGVLKTMDEQLAPLFDHIRNTPALRTNTIIIVASDNGPEPGAGSAGPFRGHKGILYEGGIREPLIVWAPGYLEKAATGTVNEATVISAFDFFPSVARLANAPLPKGVKFDGQDQSRALLGKTKNKRTAPLFWSRPPDRPGHNGEIYPDLAMRMDNWKLLLMHDGSNTQLYDLKNDQGETKNLASEKPEIVRKLSKSLRSWWRSLPENELANAKKTSG